jgi:Zn-dependent peptidase ImmA (M78 family)
MKRLQHLTLKEIINILAETDVRQRFAPLVGNTQVMGYADADNKLIVVDRALQTQTKKYVLLHELYHMSDFIRGLKTDEKYTEQRTNAHYERLYKSRFELDK